MRAITFPAMLSIVLLALPVQAQVVAVHDTPDTAAQDVAADRGPWQMMIIANEGPADRHGGMAPMPLPYNTKDACLRAARHIAAAEREWALPHSRTVHCSSVQTGHTITVNKR